MANRLHLVDATPRNEAPGFDAPALCFGPFVLHRARQLLLQDDQPVRLSSRAFQILLALVEAPGALVSKEELIARAWPGTIVEEINLRVQIASLRKLLGDAQGEVRYITNVSGRGYCFVAPVAPADVRLPTAPVLATVRQAGPTRTLWPMLGRDSELTLVLRQLSQRRLVSIIGPGGIGKTTLAIAAMQALAGQHADRVFFADLAPARDSADVVTAIATTFGVTIQGDDPSSSLAVFIRTRDVTLCLDNCEHVVDGVAGLVESLLASCPSLRVLATSREALRVDGEQRHHLGALALPPRSGAIDAKTAMQFASVQLFVERAAASLGEFQLLDTDTEAIVRLSHRLGGVPLAIELAAARIDQFGVQGLADRLDDHLLLRAPGRRTALPRHRTLRGMLDWSHELLSPEQQQVLHRLSVFRGSFSFEDAVAVVAADGVDNSSSASALVALAEKSLLLTERQGTSARYRMLEVTRAYAGEHLADLGALSQWQQRHAEYQVVRMARADARWAELGRERWLAAHADAIDDVRAALRWAREAGDDGLLSRLAAGALPLAFQLGLLGECRSWAEQALAMGGGAKDPGVAMRLLAAMGHIELQTGADSGVARGWFQRAQSLAETVPGMQRDGVAGMFVAAYGSANYPEAAEHARQLAREAAEASDVNATLLARRMLAQALHHLGEHNEAHALADSLLIAPSPGLAMASNNPLQIDRRVSMLIVLARVAWLQGRSEKALAQMETCLALAHSDSPFALCQALAMAAIPIGWWSGDLRLVEQRIGELEEQATRFASSLWHNWAAHYTFALAESRGTFPPAPSSVATTKQRDILATFNTTSVDASILERVTQGEVGWIAAEAYRAEGIRLFKAGDHLGAHTSIAAAARRAEAQGELAWELRARLTAVDIGMPHALEELTALVKRCDRIGMQGPELLLARRSISCKTANNPRRPAAPRDS